MRCSPTRSRSSAPARELHRALADVAVGHRCFRVGGREATPVEQYRDLVAGAELTVAAPALVDHAEDVPLVVRATAHRRRRTQCVVAAERGFGEAVRYRLLELDVGLQALVEIGVELGHVAVAVEAEVAREILRAGEIHEIELAHAV